MPSLPVFYDPHQAAKNNPSMSPSAGKPALVVADWEAAGIPVAVYGFEPLSPAVIALACERPNGFGNALREIADILPWTTGSMAAAAAHAAQTEGFTVSPTSGCDLLLYQAGADPHVDDPLGGVLTSEELRERDRIVFRGCVELALPVAWNLAGGYQQPIGAVLAVHRATAEECVAAMGKVHG